ncbi:IclR family transcriptional regulator [Yoonia sp. R2-816]|uniref:IclR family transcriptional regulator n=1 Tax=Yoonia sp. R2-816 TaxID=3342638 RepID=UPI00372BD78A
MTDKPGQGGGLKSLDAALAVLQHIAILPGPQALSEIARSLGMPPSKLHRYLASFVSAGLVRQHGPSGRYGLGPAAMKLGLAAMSQHDFVNSAADGLADLSAETGMTVLLSVWADQGATVVRWERGATPTDTSFGLGSTLPLLTSATGRVFLAWGPSRAIKPARDAQLRRLARQKTLSLDFTPTSEGVASLAASLRERGFATVEGRFVPGLVAIAAPVLDWQGEIQAGVTLVGVDPAAISATSEEVDALLSYCRKKSVVSEP